MNDYYRPEMSSCIFSSNYKLSIRMRCVRLCPFAQSFDHRVLIFCAIDNSETPNACSQSTAIKIHYAASRATGGARSSSSSSTKELSSSICCNLQMPPHRQSLIVFYFLLFVCMNYYYNQVQNGMITRTPQTPIYHSIIDILRMMDFFLPRCRFTNDRSFRLFARLFVTRDSGFLTNRSAENRNL